MENVRLFTRAGEYVATVSVPVYDPPVEAFGWADKVYVRHINGQYREAMLHTATTEVADPLPAHEEKPFDPAEPHVVEGGGEENPSPDPASEPEPATDDNSPKSKRQQAKEAREAKDTPTDPSSD